MWQKLRLSPVSCSLVSGWFLGAFGVVGRIPVATGPPALSCAEWRLAESSSASYNLGPSGYLGNWKSFTFFSALVSSGSCPRATTISTTEPVNFAWPMERVSATSLGPTAASPHGFPLLVYLVCGVPTGPLPLVVPSGGWRSQARLVQLGLLGRLGEELVDGVDEGCIVADQCGTNINLFDE